MSDNNNIKKSIINIEVPDSIDNAFKNLTDKPAATLGEIISDCFFLVFGRINQKAELKRVKYAIELEEFKKELETKINDIPEEKRVDANTHTICTALDNMKYCVEEKELRDMFSSLIANSINSDKESLVHPSYGEVIKQMASLDAMLFKELNSQDINPIIRIIKKTEDNGKLNLSKCLILPCLGTIDAVAASLDNLSRLKLIDVVFESYYKDERIYESMKTQQHIHAEIQKCKSMIEANSKIDYKKGYISITEYGENFYNACN